MAFIASKIVWFLVDPTNTLLLLAAFGVALRLLGRRRSGAVLVALPVLLLLVGGFLPIGFWLIQPLEERFAPPAVMPERVDGIVVLGGAINMAATVRLGSPQYGPGGDRLVAMADLMRRYPQARVVYTGGSGSLTARGRREADWIPQALEALGVDPERVIYERDARNTYENATNLRALTEQQADARWLLVTSAFHMPRSMGVLRAAGWEPIPYPVDYQSGEITAFPFRAAGRLALLGRATTEWIGLTAYRLLGRTESWLPAPEPATGGARES